MYRSFGTIHKEFTMSANRTLYGFPLSGHSHRAELALSLLGLEYRSVTVDLPAGAHKLPDFLALNPFGQVPVLDDDGTIVADSNAILTYLAAKYDDGTLMPRDAVGAAEVQRWFSVAAGEVARGPATARLINVFKAPLDKSQAHRMAERILALIETHLADRPYLAADRLTFAPGMGGLIDRFDGLILDQWGVLHNGAALYDGVRRSCGPRGTGACRRRSSRGRPPASSGARSS